MPNARPLRGRNAIEAVAFVVQYVRAFDEEELEKIAALKDSLSGEFSRAEPMQGITVQVGAPGLSQPTPNGFVFQRLDDSGKPIWIVRAFNNTLVVICYEYDRWSDVWPVASRYLKTVATAIASESLRVNVAALQITDKFVYDTLPDPYEFQDVFRPETTYLPANVASTGPVWFTSNRWAVEVAASESNGAGEPALDAAIIGNALTVTSSTVDKALVSTIDHVGQITFDKNALPANLFSGDSGRDDVFLSTVFCDLLKPNNKTIVRSLLSDLQLAAIGLTE